MAFINYVLKPEVSAAHTTEMSYPTANKASIALLAPEVAQDKSIFPDAAALNTMVAPNALGNAARESMTTVYTEFKKGK